MEDYNHVKHSIEEEGIGYFLLDYTDSDSMPSEEGAELFEDAVAALKRFETFVDEQVEIEGQ